MVIKLGFCMERMEIYFVHFDLKDDTLNSVGYFSKSETLRRRRFVNDEILTLK